MKRHRHIKHHPQETLYYVHLHLSPMFFSAQVPMREAHEETQAQLAQLEDVQGRQVEQKFKSGMKHKLLKERHKVDGGSRLQGHSGGSGGDRCRIKMGLNFKTGVERKLHKERHEVRRWKQDGIAIG